MKFLTSDGYLLVQENDVFTDGDMTFFADEEGKYPVDIHGERLDGCLINDKVAFNHYEEGLPNGYGIKDVLYKFEAFQIEVLIKGDTEWTVVNFGPFPAFSVAEAFRQNCEVDGFPIDCGRLVNDVYDVEDIEASKVVTCDAWGQIRTGSLYWVDAEGWPVTDDLQRLDGEIIDESSK